MSPELRLRTTFDEVAELYDEARPGYPEPLIDEVVSLAGLPPGGRILEVGCGTGQATLPFARRGYSMLCLELGRSLAALAAEHCRPYPNVEIQNIAFEEWPLQKEQFDLVLSAAAFDWIPPEVGYPKAAAALKDGGALALCWNDHLGGDPPFVQAARQLRRQMEMPSLDPARDKPPDARLKEQEQAIEASGLFGPTAVKCYPWSTEYTAERYVKLLSTYSSVRCLPAETRREFLAGIQELVERFGGVVETRYVAVLCVTQVKRIQ